MNFGPRTVVGRTFATYKRTKSAAHVDLSLHPPQRQLKENNMLVIFRSGNRGYSFEPWRVVSNHWSLPGLSYITVTTYGRGGGRPKKSSGYGPEEYSLGGGRRSEVYGKTLGFTTRCLRATSKLPLQLPFKHSDSQHSTLGILVYRGFSRKLSFRCRHLPRECRTVISLKLNL